MLNELMRIAVSSLDLNEVFDRIGQQVKRLVDHDRLSIALGAPGDETIELHLLATNAPRFFDTGTRLPLRETPIGEVILTGRPILRADWTREAVYPDELLVISETDLGSVMYVPLESRGHVIGTLNIASRQRGRYGEEDLRTAQEISAHLAVIVDNALAYEKSRELATRLQTLNDLMRIATSSLDLAEVFGRVGEQVKRLIDHDWLDIAIHRPTDDHLTVYAFSGGPPGILHRSARAPFETGPGEAIRTGRPIVRRDTAEESAVYPFELEVAREKGIRSAMFVPLRSKDRVIGSLNFASLRLAHYGDRELRIAEEIADHLAVIVEHALLYEESKELAALQERSRLANEIHDALAQSFIGVILELDLAERLMRTDTASAVREVDRARQMAHAGLEEARRSVLALRPAVLEVSSVSESISREVKRLVGDGATVNTSVSGAVMPASEEVETALFRIAQEAVANIRKHARATQVDVLVDYGQDALTLTVTDNGIGFDITSPPPSSDAGGLGLTSMRERARAVGGELRVESAPGRGTLVTSRIPYRTVGGTKPELGPEKGDETDALPLIRVLLADDHSVARQGMRRMLEEARDIEVVGEAADGAEALAKARALRPDVVVADMRMPGLGGIELAAALEAEGHSTRTVILTAYLQGDLVAEAMKAGAMGYLLKEVAGPELVNAVRAVHRGETFLQPAAASELARRVRNAGEQGFIERLTSREREVLGLVTKGLRNKEIARELSISEPTVKFHVAHIFQKLGVSSRVEAVARALEFAISTPP